MRGHLAIYRVEHARIRDSHSENQDFLDSPSYRVNLWEQASPPRQLELRPCAQADGALGRAW